MDSSRNAPIYNIKAVSRQTGILPDTLRRWESRYGIIVPQRTDSGYRLYSQRDIDAIFWLKEQLETGLSISRASEMLRQMGGDPATQDATLSVSSPENTLSALQPNFSPNLRADLRSTTALCEELVQSFRDIDETRASNVLNEAIGLYPLDDVCMSIIQPALIEIGELWLDGQISVAVEHFASAFVRSRLANLFHSSPHASTGPLVLVGCAPEEFHELGAMFLALFLRRAGYRVVFLGQNVPMDSLQGMIRAMKPDAICISATRSETAAALYDLREFLDDYAKEHGTAPLLSYGGQVFNRFPHITERLGGIYLGEDARVAVQRLTDHLRPHRTH
ncbi:MAG: MerR family transcriptional regulator [Chloroflexia bacterium]